MSKIHIPTPLRQYVGKQASVEVQGATVGEAMTALVAQHPDLRKHLYTEEGKLCAFHRRRRGLTGNSGNESCLQNALLHVLSFLLLVSRQSIRSAPIPNPAA